MQTVVYIGSAQKNKARLAHAAVTEILTMQSIISGLGFWIQKYNALDTIFIELQQRWYGNSILNCYSIIL